MSEVRRPACRQNPILTSGEWAGWRPIQGNDPYEDHAGPFYNRADEAGRGVTAFRVQRRHLNGTGSLHGGCAMTLADLALFVIADYAMDLGPAVTVTLNGEFIGPAHEGDLVAASGEIVHAGGSLVFLRGLISTSGRPVLSFSGVLKRLKRVQARA